MKYPIGTIRNFLSTCLSGHFFTQIAVESTSDSHPLSVNTRPIWIKTYPTLYLSDSHPLSVNLACHRLCLFLRGHGGLQTYPPFFHTFFFLISEPTTATTSKCPMFMRSLRLDPRHHSSSRSSEYMTSPLLLVFLKLWSHSFLLFTEYTTSHFLLFCFSFLLTCMYSCGRFKKS